MSQSIVSSTIEYQTRTGDTHQADRRHESRSRWMWTLFILGFFVLQALLWTFALSLVRKHPIRPIDTNQSKTQMIQSEDQTHSVIKTKQGAGV